MGELIEGLLRLARVSRTDLDLQTLDLSAMATGLLEEMRGLDPGRRLEVSVEEGLAATPRLRAWAERIAGGLREDSSSAILPPQIVVALPQPLPGGSGHYLVSTLTFGTKVTENSYQRVRSAVLSAYQAAVALRDRGQYD